MSNLTRVEEKYYARYGEYESAFKTAEQELNRKCWDLLSELKASGKLNNAHFSNTGVSIRINSDECLIVDYTNHLDGKFPGSILKWSISNGILIDVHSMEFNVMASKINQSPIQSININSLYRILQSLRR